MKNKDIDDVIIEAFADLCAQIKLASQKNLQDRNIYSEEFIGHLLNLVYSTDLKNLNTYDDQNIAGIDLGDKDKKLAIQVTSAKSREKIVKTIASFEKNHLSSGYNHLKVVLLIDSRPNFKGEFDCKGHDFTIKDDILSLSEIQRLIDKKDIGDRQIIADFLEDWFKTDSTTKTTAEMYVLKSFFRSVANVGDSEAMPIDELNQDDLKLKKERFDDFWSHVQSVYLSIVEPKLEAAFTNVNGSLSQGERDKIRKYLKYQSALMLLYKHDPVEIIDDLKQKILDEINMRLVSETLVVSFLYYHFFRCNVLPNPVKGVA